MESRMPVVREGDDVSVLTSSVFGPVKRATWGDLEKEWEAGMDDEEQKTNASPSPAQNQFTPKGLIVSTNKKHSDDISVLTANTKV